MNCSECGDTMSASDRICPRCGARRPMSELTRDAGGPENALTRDLDQIMSESMLVRTDATADLMDDLENNESRLVAPDQIESMLDRNADIPTFEQLQNCLDRGDSAALVFEGIELSKLLEVGVDVSDVIRKGFLFIKKNMLNEAVEWWTLQRNRLDRQDTGAHLLLLVMEMLTHMWQGNTDCASRIRSEVRRHPAFKK